MSKFKKIGIILTVVVLTFLLTGCGSKSVKTTKDFTALANSYNLILKMLKSLNMHLMILLKKDMLLIIIIGKLSSMF